MANKRIRLTLTGCGEILTLDAEKKLEQGESYQTPTCDNGLTEEQYQDLGIPLPDSLVQKLKKHDKGVELEDEDFEQVTSHMLVYEDEIKLVVTEEDFTTIFLKDGLTITVLEEADEIDMYIDFLQRGWFRKLKDSVFILFRRIKWNLSKEKKQIIKAQKNKQMELEKELDAI